MLINGLFLIILQLNYKFGENKELNDNRNDFCKTSDNQRGKCVAQQDCQTLKNSVQTSTFKAGTNELQHDSFCDSNFNKEPKVCCPIDDYSACGKSDSDTRWPWVASLVYQRKHGNSIFEFVVEECVGSLISSQWIVTAVHCLKQPENNEQILARFENSYLDEDENRTKLKDVFVIQILSHPNHPQYSKVYGQNNISLLFLKDQVTFTPSVRPICLPDKYTLKKEALYFTLKLGGTKRGHEFVEAKSYQTCQENDSLINAIADKGALCVQNNGSDSCQINPGAPFMLRFDKNDSFYLIGILAHKDDFCKNRQYSEVYTRISHSLLWINQTMKRYKK